MDNRGYQAYRDQAVNAVDTMTQGELLLKLYDELVKRLTRAELALAKEDYSLMEASVDRGLDIIHYLDDTLDPQYPISHDLTRLYEYFCFELQRVKAGRNRTELDRVKKMSCELRDAFREAHHNTEGGK